MLMEGKREYYQGDLIAFSKKIDGYMPKDGWDLTYHFNNNNFIFAIPATASEDGESYSLRIESSTSSLWPPGRFYWQSKVRKNDDVLTIEEGDFKLKASIQSNSEDSIIDNRTNARRILENIDEHLSNPDSIKVSKVSINGRELTSYSINQLLTLRNYYEAIAFREINSERAKKGQSYMNVIKVINQTIY